MTKTILGLFDNRENVEEAISKLHEEGFNTKNISIVMKNQVAAKDISNDTGANVAGSTLSGVGTGAVVGGVAGFLAGT
ncbi:MAG: general stress protein, partial [Rhabdochlamydiaceae bacterium]